MKIQQSFKSMMSLSAGNPLPTAAPISMKHSGFTRINGAAPKPSASLTIAGRSRSGCAGSRSGRSLLDQAGDEFFTSMMFVLLGMNALFWTVYLALDLSLAAPAFGAVAYYLLQRAVRHGRKSSRLYQGSAFVN